MSENKRYYWLKIPENFFDDDTVQFIEMQDNGAEYLLLYLKLCCRSTPTKGRLFRLIGGSIIPYDAKALARVTNTNVDTVAKAMEFFHAHGILTILETGEIYIEQVAEMVGSETNKARAMRELRARRKIKALGGNAEVTKLPQCSKKLQDIEIDTEIDTEIDKEIERKKKKKARRFKPPTLKEVEAYCQEKGLCVNPEIFVDYYEGNGWKVGKNPMKSWQATLRNWNRRELKDSRRQSPDQIAGGYFELLTEEERNGQSGNG